MMMIQQMEAEWDHYRKIALMTVIKIFLELRGKMCRIIITWRRMKEERLEQGQGEYSKPSVTGQGVRMETSMVEMS